MNVSVLCAVYRFNRQIGNAVALCRVYQYLIRIFGMPTEAPHKNNRKKNEKLTQDSSQEEGPAAQRALITLHSLTHDAIAGVRITCLCELLNIIFRINSIFMNEFSFRHTHSARFCARASVCECRNSSLMIIIIASLFCGHSYAAHTRTDIRRWCCRVNEQKNTYRCTHRRTSMSKQVKLLFAHPMCSAIYRFFFIGMVKPVLFIATICK